jgi:hypothetical protein
MGGAGWHEHRTSGTRLNLIVANPERKRAFEHVPRLIVRAVQMRWRNQAHLSGSATGITPFRNHELAAVGSKYASGQRRCNHLWSPD